MRFLTLAFIVVTSAGSNGCMGEERATNAQLVLPGPTGVVNSEPGVVPSGTSLESGTNDTVRAGRELRGTIYDAGIAEDVLDQSGTVLIPKDSPVELVVRSLAYLGPGGAGMTELTLAVRAITVDGVSYPVETERGLPGPGGLGVDRGGATVVSEEAIGHVLPKDRRIDVPPETLLAFRLKDPIRLRGHRQ